MRRYRLRREAHNGPRSYALDSIRGDHAAGTWTVFSTSWLRLPFAALRAKLKGYV